MNVGAFVCSCGGTCDVDLEAVRDGVRDVEVVASSETLCRDALPAVDGLIDEYELDQLVVGACDDGCRARFDDLVAEKGLHPDAAAFVDHREEAGWVHSEPEATDKTARLVNARRTGLEYEAPTRSVSREAGESVVVVGDAGTAAALADTADVTLVADGAEYADVDADLSDVEIERGRFVDVEGAFGEFEVTLVARVTEDCISCMKCVREGPDGMVTRRPVDVHPDAPDGGWTDCCPTDAIDLSGVERSIDADQVIHPAGTDSARGGRVGYYTGPVDGATIAAVESLLGGVEKPRFLDLEMDVCAAGESSQQGCTACVDACPHGAVDRPAVDEVEFDLVACQNCGACTSSCPTGATKLAEPSNERLAREVEALLDAETDEGGWLFDRGGDGIETPVVAFVCSESAAEALRAYGRRAASGEEFSYAPILPVRVNCTDTVGEAHAMHALAAGADGVAVVGCGDACLHSGPDPKAELVERLNRATTDLGLGERLAFLAPDPGDPDGFAAELDAFVSGLDATPIPEGEHRSTGVIRADKPNPEFNSHDWTLESVRRIVEFAKPEREVIRGLKDFGLMDVTDACNLTPTCSTLCPTDAIRRTDDGDLQFAHEDCVNCGLCEEGCPETAITMSTGLDLGRLPEARDGERWETVYEGEMLECALCGKPFTSAASAEHIREQVGDLVEGVAPGAEHSIFEYCGDCRAELVFEHS
ncbi:hydrogenase iron-sulfur subunit [Halorarum halophilum]|uniref:Hydrogenase iron-sulfur subunit n=1 Tax=Halorarum halophilum TaxID=2743090 RepID=A0A7D5GBW6_9EURY|nr:hydrogenase iron-sulfur subunit [Halobaculum halophilum]QLG27765.1 hydrogenase iron-sulfur subunit [Halobaculum halophilum]